MSELGLRLRFWLGQLRGRKVRVDGHQIFVPPGVLDPVLFRSGAWFSEAVAARLTGNERLLDLGCGSGVVGLVAQARGARVTAVDISAPAVAAARDNGLVDVRQSDLFEGGGARACQLPQSMRRRRRRRAPLVGVARGVDSRGLGAGASVLQALWMVRVPARARCARLCRRWISRATTAG